MLFIDI